MAGPIRFDGRVVLITGAGAGLGRAYALAFAERGAKVVVNDLGGNIKGEGASGRVADQVVEEIRAKGGTAVANYDSVEFGDKLVQTALDNFGRIDIIINNAGILRDKSFARTSDLDWDLIQRIHLRGSFQVTRAAWPHMRKNGYGRIIMTTSSSGIYGNFGQANYSAAKLGMVGLAKTLAIEGKKYNITCNSIAPTAGSRLTRTVMTDDMVQVLKPEYVAPLVMYLTHDSCTETGGIFEVGAGHVSAIRWQKSQGNAFLQSAGSSYTPEQVRDKWDKITDFETDPWYPSSNQEANQPVYAAIQALASSAEEEKQGAAVETKPTAGAGDHPINPELAMQAKLPESSFSYTDRDVILYALGVGVSTTQPDHLKFIYEFSPDFCVLPTFAVIPAMLSSSGLFGGGMPGLKIDITKILHGEQYTELYKPLPTSGTIKSQSRIVDVLDKGSGAVVIMNMDTFNEQGEKICFNQFVTFVNRHGGFGGKRNSDKAIQPVKPPTRAPDASIQEKVYLDQAAVYRLSGDRNPLHIDPSFAAMGGFQQPILHGLCSYGMAARAVLKQYCDNDVTKFKAIKVRFNRPVLPGQTLQTDMWKDGSRVYLQSKVVETGQVALSGGYVDLHGSGAAAKQEDKPASSLKSDAVFEEMGKRVASNPGLVKKVNAVYQFNVTDGKKVLKSYIADLQKGDVYPGPAKSGTKAQCTLTLSDSDMQDMVTGKLNAQKAFMTGKLKISGNIMLSQKLSNVFQDQSKL